MTRHGTWEDLLPELNADEERLLGLLAGEVPKSPVHTYCAERIPQEYSALSIDLPKTHLEGKNLVIHLRTLYPISAPVVLHYRHEPNGRRVLYLDSSKGGRWLLRYYPCGVSGR